MPSIDAVIAAGGVPQPGNPLYPLTQGRPRALLSIAGQPLAQWVIDALAATPEVRRVVVTGLGPEAGFQCAKPLDYVPDQGSLLANSVAGVRWLLQQDPTPRRVLLVSSDIPTITPAVVNWLIDLGRQSEHEVFYTLVPQAAMEQRFPASRRSYFHFKEGAFTGGDMHLISTQVVSHIPPKMHAILEARKNALRQASLIGWDVLFGFALRRIALADCERLALDRLQVKGKPVICPHAEAGMDVDKPAQFELAERDLLARRAAA